MGDEEQIVGRPSLLNGREHQHGAHTLRSKPAQHPTLDGSASCLGYRKQTYGWPDILNMILIEILFEM